VQSEHLDLFQKTTFFRVLVIISKIDK
jgi:hypothetical protein